MQLTLLLLFALALLQCVIAPTPTPSPTPSNILLDAGSSGTKLKNKKITKLDALVKKGATLMYGDADPFVVSDDMSPQQRGAKYAEKIKEHLGQDKVAAILATAGMRQPIDELNQPKLWSGLCSALKITDKDKCGVIPGTTEALYEWIGARECVHYHQHGDACRSGIISMGGASAQIAIPLTKKEMGTWLEYRNALKKNEDKFFHYMAHPIPSHSPISGYAENFFYYRAASKDLPEIPFWRAQKCSEHENVGLGLISFLSVDGPHRKNSDGTDSLSYTTDGKEYVRHIAGGANSVLSYFSTFWPDLCAGEMILDDCLNAMKEKLSKDPFWTNTINFLRVNKFHERQYDLITPSVDIIQSVRFLFGKPKETPSSPTESPITSEYMAILGLNEFLKNAKEELQKNCPPPIFSLKDKTGEERMKMEKCLKIMWIYTYIHTLLGGGSEISAFTREECPWSKGAELYLKIRTLKD